MSPAKERARWYSRQRWTLYGQLGQLEMARSIVRAHQSPAAFVALSGIDTLIIDVKWKIQRLNDQQKEELGK